MDLSERLQRIVGAPKSQAKKSSIPLEELVSGEWCQKGQSKIFVAFSSRTWTTRQKNYSRLKNFVGLGADISPEKVLFLDTETTGLAGGTGTYAFMVGLGFLDSGKFQTVQLFMPKFSDEPHMLSILKEYFDGKTHIVTFNGKTFDIPLLETRYLMMRERNPFSEFDHLDLLHTSRIIWKKRLQSCSLQNLECNLLGKVREGDIPGELIPEVYFDYIRTNDPTDMTRVFEHNQQDVVSMMSLLEMVGSIFETPDSPFFEDPTEQLSGGQYLWRKGFSCEGMEYMQRASDTTNRKLRDEAMFTLGRLCKKQGEFEKAAKHFESVCHDPCQVIEALVEQAKHFEHRTKEIGRALEVTEKAMSVARQIKLLSENEMAAPAIDELRHRHERLVRKKSRLDNQ